MFGKYTVSNRKMIYFHHGDRYILNEVEYITRHDQVIEEIEYGDCYTLEVIYPKWKGLNVWYVTPLLMNKELGINEPTFILTDGTLYRFAKEGYETEELTKFWNFYNTVY